MQHRITSTPQEEELSWGLGRWIAERIKLWPYNRESQRSDRPTHTELMPQLTALILKYLLGGGHGRITRSCSRLPGWPQAAVNRRPYLKQGGRGGGHTPEVDLRPWHVPTPRHTGIIHRHKTEENRGHKWGRPFH